MRKLLVLWLVVLAAPAAALAAADATGDGSLAVTRASGTIFVQGRGVIYGHFDSGTLMVLDYRPDDLTSVPAVSSGRSKYSGSSGVYTGTDVRFLLPSGRYTIELIGVRIDASAVGRGNVVVSGLGTLDDGSFAVNGGRPQPLTRFADNDTFGYTLPSLSATNRSQSPSLSQSQSLTQSQVPGS
jgi:hypothetical protein